MLEVVKILSNPLYALPVGGVLLFAFLVFMFGFKTPLEPTFIESDDRKKKIVKPKSKPKKKVSSDVEEKKPEKTKASPRAKSKSPAKSAAVSADIEVDVKPVEPVVLSKAKKTNQSR